MVSSAYWLILHSTLFVFMPLMFLSFLTALANISAQGIKIYGERGHPCPSPRSSRKYPEDRLRTS